MMDNARFKRAKDFLELEAKKTALALSAVDTIKNNYEKKGLI